MPKFTRDELFQQAIAEYLLCFDVILDVGEIQQYGIQTYTLTNKTQNKTKFEHDYDLIIPKEIIIAHRDITVERDDNEVAWIDSEPIYGEHELPTPAEFIKSFDDYFAPYKLYVSHTLISYVRIQQTHTTLSRTNLTFHIKVVYFKSHSPFPRPLTELEEKEQEIKFLKAKVEAKTKKIITFRSILERERARSLYNYKRMQAKFRSMYATCYKFEDCPVCYEIITPDKLIIPNCFHYICESCVVKCESCPLCRDEYDRYIESVHYIPTR